MREKHEAHKPDPQNVKSPPEDGKADGLNHAYNAYDDKNDGNWFKHFAKLLQHH